MATETERNAGDFRFGLGTKELHNDFVQSLYRDLEPLREWGEVPAGTTYWEVADVILDTISGYTSIAPIDATDLAQLIADALEQLQPGTDTLDE